MDDVMMISVNYLKSHSAINDNVADELLTNSIFEAQNIYLQSILGTALFNKLVTLIQTGDISLSVNVNYKYLLDNYIQHYVCYRATEQCIPYLMVKLVNKGPQTQFSDYSANGDIKKVEYLRDDLVNKCDFYAQRLTDYLIDNQSLFPEYLQNRKRDIRPDKNNYFCGIELGKHGWRIKDLDGSNNYHTI